MINSSELCEYFKNCGFIAEDPSELSLRDFIEICQNTKFLVIDGGAAIANLMFMQSGVKIMVLAMSKGTDPSLFASFCQGLGLN